MRVGARNHSVPAALRRRSEEVARRAVRLTGTHCLCFMYVCSLLRWCIGRGSRVLHPRAQPSCDAGRGRFGLVVQSMLGLGVPGRTAIARQSRFRRSSACGQTVPNGWGILDSPGARGVWCRWCNRICDWVGVPVWRGLHCRVALRNRCGRKLGSQSSSPEEQGVRPVLTTKTALAMAPLVAAAVVGG
jgi:hypothetical protein